jgi:tetratricopeptide (TPR) repeat protein
MKILAECVSVHSAATWLMDNEPWDVMAVYYDAIDHFCHGFMRYHPPRQPFVSERDFDLYSGVIEGCYRFHDMMLGALLQLAGEDTHVILSSDHGFHPDHNRPADIPDEPAGPAVEHRDFGILVMAGNGLRRDELIHGASLLDLTPTMLTMLGLPIGADMDGKPLVQAFESPPAVKTIPSWDAVPGDAGMHDTSMQSDPLASQEALNQLIELGYIEPLDENREKAVANIARELRFNLARAYMDGERHAEAVPILKELYEKEPDQHRFGLQLALCYRALGWIERMRPLVETLHERRIEQAQESREKLVELNREIEERKAKAEGEPELSDLLSEKELREYRSLRGRAQVRAYDVEYLRGYVAASEGDHTQALGHLLRAEKAEPRRPGLHIQIGESYLQLKRWADAERALLKAMEIDPENPHVHLGLARSCLGRRRAKRAAEAAIKSVSLHYNNPMAHFVLGRALAQMGRYGQAAEAFEVAVTLNPNFAQAHRRLAQIFGRRLDLPDKAREHRDLARAIRQAGKPAPPEDFRTVMEMRPVESVVEPHLHTLGASADGDEPAVTVVTGLPRSGTSMMMQMLAAGGLAVLSDGKREADDDNPRGYFELEAATRLRSDRAWLADAVGKCVKIVAQLLPSLPGDRSYRVVFMQRDLDEILASQERMLKRLGRKSSSLPPEKLRETFEQQITRVKRWLKRRSIPVVFVDYTSALDDPPATADALATFLGGSLDTSAMADAVAPSLYRQRQSQVRSVAAATE